MTQTLNVSTKYLPATNARGSRILVKVRSTGQQLTVSYDYAANNPHESAIRSMFPHVMDIEYTGDTNRGQEYLVTLPDNSGPARTVPEGSAVFRLTLTGYELQDILETLATSANPSGTIVQTLSQVAFQRDSPENRYGRGITE